MSDVHLHNAARTLARILNARDPEHVYTVDVTPRDGDDASSDTDAPVGESKVGAVAKDSNTVGDRHLGTRPNRPHRHGSKQAA